MSKSCCNCKHCYDDEICTLFDELIEGNCCCWMWNGEDS